MEEKRFLQLRRIAYLLALYFFLSRDYGFAGFLPHWIIETKFPNATWTNLSWLLYRPTWVTSIHWLAMLACVVGSFGRMTYATGWVVGFGFFVLDGWLSTVATADVEMMPLAWLLILSSAFDSERREGSAPVAPFLWPWLIMGVSYTSNAYLKTQNWNYWLSNRPLRDYAFFWKELTPNISVRGLEILGWFDAPWVWWALSVAVILLQWGGLEMLRRPWSRLSLIVVMSLGVQHLFIKLWLGVSFLMFPITALLAWWALQPRPGFARPRFLLIPLLGSLFATFILMGFKKMLSANGLHFLGEAAGFMLIFCLIFQVLFRQHLKVVVTCLAIFCYITPTWMHIFRSKGFLGYAPFRSWALVARPLDEKFGREMWKNGIAYFTVTTEKDGEEREWLLPNRWSTPLNISGLSLGLGTRLMRSSEGEQEVFTFVLAHLQARQQGAGPLLGSMGLNHANEHLHEKGWKDTHIMKISMFHQPWCDDGEKFAFERSTLSWCQHTPKRLLYVFNAQTKVLEREEL